MSDIYLFNPNNPPAYIKYEERGFEVVINGKRYNYDALHLVAYENPLFNPKECFVIRNIKDD